MMTLIRTSLLNGIAVLVKILSLLGINKLLAIYVGPIGYAALGQFQNAISLITTFASGAINTGVTKYTAEYYEDEQRQHAVWQTAGTISLIGAGLSSFFIIIYNKPLARWFLNDETYAGVFIWFAASLVFFVFNALLLAILNGKKEVGSYVLANISGSLFALMITTLLVLFQGLYGALVALAIFQSLNFLVSLTLCSRKQWFKLSYLLGSFDKTLAYNLLKYTSMAVTTALCVPLSHIYIRNHLGLNLGWESAGCWEAMWRLSAAYLMLVTTTLSGYYLPRIAEIKTDAELRQEVFKIYKVIMPIALLAAGGMYLCRDFIISMLLSREFYPIRELFLGQVIGDMLKIGSWILAYIMLGRAMTKSFIFTEVLFSVSFALLAVKMTAYYGLQGVVWAYGLNYLFYGLSLYLFIFKGIEKEQALCLR